MRWTLLVVACAACGSSQSSAPPRSELTPPPGHRRWITRSPDAPPLKGAGKPLPITCNSVMRVKECPNTDGSGGYVEYRVINGPQESRKFAIWYGPGTPYQTPPRTELALAHVQLIRPGEEPPAPTTCGERMYWGRIVEFAPKADRAALKEAFAQCKQPPGFEPRPDPSAP